MNKTVLALSVLISLSCFGAYETNYYVDSGGYQNSTSSTYISDADLVKKIREKLTKGWFSSGYDQVTVQSYNGNITLGGTVKTQKDKETVEREVQNINGVHSVNNQITVQESSGSGQKSTMNNRFKQDTAATPQDQELNAKIRDKISAGLLWDSYRDVILNTSNGIVILEGSVKSSKDQKALVDKIQSIDGVKNVKSNLKITTNTQY